MRSILAALPALAACVGEQATTVCCMPARKSLGSPPLDSPTQNRTASAPATAEVIAAAPPKDVRLGFAWCFQAFRAATPTAAHGRTYR